jgi:hypothetical protein
VENKIQGGVIMNQASPQDVMFFLVLAFICIGTIASVLTHYTIKGWEDDRQERNKRVQGTAGCNDREKAS